jgi:hypothetical protein
MKQYMMDHRETLKTNNSIDDVIDWKNNTWQTKDLIV